MAVDRVKFQNIVASQLPRYVREDFPLLVDFLEQYYLSQEVQSGTLDLIQNIDQYVKVEELTNLKNSTVLGADLSIIGTTITCSVDSNFTEGFVDTNGLIKIDDEIIFYKSKTDTTFEGCVRGFSGVTSYQKSNTPDELVFSNSSVTSHKSGAIIYNLNVIFLQEFLKKLKNQITPGFQDRSLAPNLNQKNFIYNVDSFYKTKGTDRSFKILFGALYGEDVEVIHPSEYLFRPSDADYRVTQDFVVKAVRGNPLELKNLTLYQNATGARGSVSDVEKINYSEGDYYKISIDYGYQRDIDVDGTIYSEFSPNPITKILNDVSINSTIIDVDSTSSFPESGSLSVKDIDNNDLLLSYSGKNITQFLNVTGVRNKINSKSDIELNDYSYAFVGFDRSREIRVRITSTLKDLQLSKSHSYKKGDLISVKNFGYTKTNEKLKNWSYNVKSKFDIKSVSQVDLSEEKYVIKTYDDIELKPGYNFLIQNSTKTVSTIGYVLSINSSNSFVAKISANLNLNDTYTIENQILKGNSTKYPILKQYFANVQNTYVNSSGDILVSSNSIPNYDNIITNPYDKKIKFSGTYTSTQTLNLLNHGFYTGDVIYYQPTIIETISTDADGVQTITESVSGFEGIDEGVYYVSRVDGDNFKLARSRGNLFADKFITLNGTVKDNQIIYYEFYNKNVLSQPIYREITNPSNIETTYKTKPGYTGILINGVEILNYKSSDVVYYGEVEEITISSPGSGYDVINPPSLIINDEVGTGATGKCSVSGKLERIEIIDPGFDYVNTPIVKINGGNGRDASAEVNLISVDNEVFFNSQSTSSDVNLTNNTIGFSTFHKFRDYEKIVYLTNSQTSVGGISTGSFYYVGIVNDKTIKLYKNQSDSISGINTISLTSYGTGTQIIKSSEKKQVVSDILVTNSGYGYENKERIIPTSGISTSLNQILISNHGYSSKDIVRYTAGSSPISGISENKNYYVVKVDDDKFSLTEIGTGSTDADYYYSNNIFKNLTSDGNGSFNYEPITVTVDGIIGVSTSSGQDFSCKVQPIFRGSLDSISLESGGSKYGSSESINFNRQPDITFFSGENAQLVPIIKNGQITKVEVTNSGRGYNSPPNLTIVSGTGKNAVLTPVISNGEITEVKVIKGGAGYVRDKTSIIITPAGSGAKSDVGIKIWTVNLFERNFDNIRDDDGFISGNISDESLQYSHLYAPRPLRKSTYSISGNDEDNTVYGTPDLIFDGTEIDSRYHSPIIGWAYDGNPIYGPYGFSNKDGTGSIRRMKSGYVNQSMKLDRPNFNSGFFVEDFKYVGNGDLDENNGRYCVTPDYPNGVYAYFTTINENIDSDGPFIDHRRPVFPYLIGNTYKSIPNNFNFRSISNQTDYNLQTNTWLRYIIPYHIRRSNSRYDYIFDSDLIKKQTIEVTSSLRGEVQSVGIITGGDNYKIGDEVVFNNENTGGFDATAKVSRIGGKVIDTISLNTETNSDVEFLPISNLFTGFTTTPHNLTSNDVVQIVGLSSYYKGFDGSYVIGINTSTWTLTSGIQSATSTGIVTYINVSGSFDYPIVRENDILGIGTEKVKVLNIDKLNSRFRVLREQESTVGSAHTRSTKIYEDSSKFTVNVGSIKTTRIFKVNRELYFDPSESVGIGTTLGTGVGNTITFSNPGAGITQVFVSPQRIYYPNHGLKLNDPITYSSNGGTSIQVWNGTDSYKDLTDYPNLFAANITDNHIGISSNKIGIGTTGSYVGLGTDSALLYFTSVGTGSTHSFKTNLNNVLSGKVDKNVVTVSTASSHSLTVRDKININVKPKDVVTIQVKYDDYNRRIVFDPKSFTSSDVDITKNTIQFSSGDFKTGDRVIHTSSSPSGGLINEEMYYVITYDETEVRLVRNHSDLTSQSPEFVNITSAGSGTLSKVNPSINVSKNNTLKFDLSDSSLAFTNNSNLYSAFNLNLYSDKNFLNEFLSLPETSTFEVKRNGRPGIDSDANLTLFVSDVVPSILYYKFGQLNLEFLPNSKKSVVDNTVNGFNQINLIESPYSGSYSITSVGSTTFTYNITSSPKVTTYDSSNSLSSYNTNSSSALGSVERVDVLNGGSSYEILPGISTVSSDSGTGVILEAFSENIGKITGYKFNEIGFSYPTDNTIRLTANLPEILNIDPFSSFESIGITSGGQNYLVAPKLVVLDGFTNEVVKDIDLIYNLGDTQVTILQNTFGIYNTTPRIIPTNNSNGVGISSISYTSSTKNVRVYLDEVFGASDTFPFAIGSKVLIEGVNVGLGSTGRGYDSQKYNYKLFSLTGVNTALGGSGAYVDYSLEGLITSSETPGSMDLINSYGRIIPEDQFPIFNPILKTSELLVGETVVSGSKVGIVQRWNSTAEYLFVSSSDEFLDGEIIQGLTSKSKASIKKQIEFDSEIIVGAGATFINGWEQIYGFLNNNLQRIPNNEYYQKFSYSLKSKIPYDIWNDPVSSLDHTAGFEKFSDLQVISIEDDSRPSVVLPEDSNLELTVDIVGEANLNCVYDFDEVTETVIDNDGILISKEINFNNKFLVDFYESIGNRVLYIDDISYLFNSNIRPTQFTSVSKFPLSYTYNKIITFAKDSVYTDERQASIVSLIQKDNTVYLQEYANLDTITELGSFDYLVPTDNPDGEWLLTFYPIKSEYNNYELSTVSFSSVNGVVGVGSTDIGDIVHISSSQTNVAAATTTTIVSISSTYRSAKILVDLEDTSQEHYGTELSIIHDGTNVYELEYGSIVTNGTSGFGTFYSYIDGGNIKIDFTPSVGVALTSNASIVAISDNSTGIGSIRLSVADLITNYKSIPSSGSPSAVGIASYDQRFYNTSYNIITVEDTTNSQYETFEVLVLNSSNIQTFVEYGNVQSGGSIGTIGISSTGNYISIDFTPNPSTAVQVRTFEIPIQIFDDNTRPDEIDLNNESIICNDGTYTGSLLDLKTTFDITHEGINIFEREIDGSSTEFVDLVDNQIIITEHFFVTGEKIDYQAVVNGLNPNASPISIASTNVPGVGVTDKLPSTVYVVKDSDVRIRLAGSAEDALASVPVTFDFTSVGVGTVHRFTSTNQNSKVLIAVDNMIQSPIVSSGVTALLNENIVFDTRFEISGVTSISSSDLLQIDDEIVYVTDVGIGGENNIDVRRAWMGTVITSHNTNSLVTKIIGNYNITRNTLNFSQAPYGQVPLSTSFLGPDEVDWTGITTNSTFQGRTFLRSGIENSSEHTYSDNYVFDDISEEFTGVQSSFVLKSDESNVSGISTWNSIILINGIFQQPKRVSNLPQDGDYDLQEGSGITTITFTGSNSVPEGYDPNRTSLPLGGSIISLASTEGFGYQPLVAAGGTAVVSTSGTISSISIGNSGSGYRVGIQTIVNVGVQTYSSGTPNIEFIGTASISGGNIVSVAITNPGSGYTSTNPPLVVFDEPLRYDDIPLQYSSVSAVGSGLSATVNITVGQGSSVISFTLQDPGYGFGNGEILTVPIGGTTGIPTDTSKTFSEFQLTIDRIYNDSFNGWSIGVLDVLDNIDQFFDGTRKSFKLRKDGELLSIASSKGSKIDIEQNLLIFINDILQKPSLSYNMKGSSIIVFDEPPTQGDTSKILFYKGSGDDVDVIFREVLDTVKVGDSLNIDNDPSKGQSSGLDQDDRIVTDIQTVDTVKTNPYLGPGITTDATLSRPVTWCRQTVDKVIDGIKIGKDREHYEPLIYPSSFIIQSVGIGSTLAYVDSVRPLFNSQNEALIKTFQDKIDITSQDITVGASATVTVSSAGTITSINIVNAGSGYTSAPSVTIGNPIGLGTESRATATSIISVGGTVTGFTITSPGTGYTSTNLPPVLISEENTVRVREIGVSSYQGDYGVLVGFGTTTISSQNKIIVDFYIPTDSFMRDNDYVGTGITVSGISTGDYFTLFGTNISIGDFTSQRTDGSNIGMTTSFLDCVYQVSDSYQLEVDVIGIGTTSVVRVFTNVNSIDESQFSSVLSSFDSPSYTRNSNTFSVYEGGISSSRNFGQFSWGKIEFNSELTSGSFNFHGNDGYSGISTSSIISRSNSLKYENYI